MVNDTTISNLQNNVILANNFGITIGIFAIIVGTVGNLCTIIIVATNKIMMASCFNLLVLSLATVDFITAAFMLPSNVLFYINKTAPNPNYCKFQAFFYYNCGYISVVHFVIIAVTRYIGIVLPNDWNYLVNEKRFIYLWIFISWTFAPIVLFPFWFEENGGFGWYDAYTLCVFKSWEYSVEWKNYMIFSRILFQLLPAILMSFIYFVIYKTINKSERMVSSFKSTETLEGGGSNQNILKINKDFKMNRPRQRSESFNIKRQTLCVINDIRKALSVSSAVTDKENSDESNSLTPVTPINDPRRESITKNV